MKPLRNKMGQHKTLTSSLRILAVADGDTATSAGGSVDSGSNEVFMVGSLACGRQLDASIASLRPGYHDSMEKVVARHPLHRQSRDTEYWMSRSPSHCLDAVGILRLAWLESHPDAVQGLQRVCRVTNLYDD
ncbi:MAG: hypothetical protein Q8L44_03660 [Sulfuritalea sp.]|nr:hypothetical protein [Sulfuritalea sp.]